MLIRIFKANNFYNFILFPIVGILLLLKSFHIQGVVLAPPNCGAVPLFKQLYSLNLPYHAGLVINYVAIMIISLQLLLINANFSFVRERTFLPVYLFMFIILGFPGLHVIQPVFIAAIFILLALHNLFASFEKRKVIINGFNAAFFIGVAGLFYPGLNILVFLVPASLYALKNKIGLREWVASFIGLLLPHLYTFTYYFLTNNLNDFISIYTNLITFKDFYFFIQIPVIAYFAFLMILTFVASLFMLKGYDEKKISTRGYFKILFFFFASSLVLFAVPVVSYELIVILALPLTFLLTNYLTFMKRRFWAEFFFILLIAFSVVLQFWVR